MNIILMINRLINRLRRSWRHYIFRYNIACVHSDFRLIGDVTLINKKIHNGHNVTIYPGVMFWGDGDILIGDNVNIGNNTIIYASKNGGVSIGNNTNIAAQCYIIDMDHGIEKGSLIHNQRNSVMQVIIGEDCWLGANVTVLKGSIIEDGAVVGANALVKGIVPHNAIAVGSPAKTIKYR